jgi:hypothetical protein
MEFSASVGFIHKERVPPYNATTQNKESLNHSYKEITPAYMLYEFVLPLIPIAM